MLPAVTAILALACAPAPRDPVVTAAAPATLRTAAPARTAGPLSASAAHAITTFAAARSLDALVYMDMMPRPGETLLPPPPAGAPPRRPGPPAPPR